MSIKIQILEDNPLHLAKLKNFCSKMSLSIVSATDSVAPALGDLLAESPDIALVDIQLKGEKTGIDFALKARDVSDCAIIFITSLLDESVIEQASLVQPEAYLVKPLDENSLQAAISLALKMKRGASKPMIDQNDAEEAVALFDSFFIKIGSMYNRLNFDDIDAISAGGKNYADLILSNGKKYPVRKTLGDMERLLPKSFWRIHRQHIVNAKKIEAIDSAVHSLKIGNNHYAISRSYQKEVVTKFKYLS